MEKWYDTKFPNHQVSDEGNVRNKKNGHILKPHPDRYGYDRLSIGNVDNVPVHRLICETIHGPAPEGKNQVNHIDCNRRNNKADNLEWCSASENIQWGVKHGNIDPIKASNRAAEVNPKPVRLVEANKEFPSVKMCAEYLGVPPTHVSRCLVGVRKGQRIHGYHVEFVKKEDE